MRQIDTPIMHLMPLAVCRLHLENYILYESGEYPSTNLASIHERLAERAINGAIRDELELLLSNLLLTYGESTVILALRSTKMFNYCRRYLKVG